MEGKKFDPKKLAKLNDPKRTESLNPELIWNALGLAGPKVLVDIGAGTGFFSRLFSDRMKTGVVYACDTSEVMIDWMKENLPPDLEGRVVPLKTEESALPLDSGSADLVTMLNLHHEIEEPERILREAFRVLKGGGTAAIIDWKAEETPEGPPLSIRVAPELIEAQMAGAGFVNVRRHDLLPYHNFLVGEKP